MGFSFGGSKRPEDITGPGLEAPDLSPAKVAEVESLLQQADPSLAGLAQAARQEYGNYLDSGALANAAFTRQFNQQYLLGQAAQYQGLIARTTIAYPNLQPILMSQQSGKSALVGSLGGMTGAAAPVKKAAPVPTEKPLRVPRQFDLERE